MSTVTEHLLTAADLLEMPEGDRYELVDGQLVERDMGAMAGWVGNQVAHRLTTFVDARRLGWVFGDGVGFRIYEEDPERVRKPDASFLARHKLPDGQIPTGFLRVPPDLVVEVVSPNDSYYAVEQKVEEFLRAGVQLVWVVNPDQRVVRVFRSDGTSPVDYREQDELTGDAVLPGFACRVGELFPSPQ